MKLQPQIISGIIWISISSTNENIVLTNPSTTSAIAPK
jgi:hypothetical protein